MFFLPRLSRTAFSVGRSNSWSDPKMQASIKNDNMARYKFQPSSGRDMRTMAPFLTSMASCLAPDRLQTLVVAWRLLVHWSILMQKKHLFRNLYAPFNWCAANLVAQSRNRRVKFVKFRLLSWPYWSCRPLVQACWGWRLPRIASGNHRSKHKAAVHSTCRNNRLVCYAWTLFLCRVQLPNYRLPVYRRLCPYRAMLEQQTILTASLYAE